MARESGSMSSPDLHLGEVPAMGKSGSYDCRILEAHEARFSSESRMYEEQISPSEVPYSYPCPYMKRSLNGTLYSSLQNLFKQYGRSLNGMLYTSLQNLFKQYGTRYSSL